MQAIVTKFFGPTDTRGSRVRASCQAARITLSWDHALNPAENHLAAARALCAKLGWGPEWYGTLAAGELPDGTGSAYVLTGSKHVSNVYPIIAPAIDPDAKHMFGPGAKCQHSCGRVRCHILHLDGSRSTT